MGEKKCTCGGIDIGVGIMHEPGCGEDPESDLEVFVFPSSSMPAQLRDALEHTWVWFVLRQGRLIAAGSDVCSSIAWECADRVVKNNG